jgi:signal transduction histidine kinase
LALLAHLLSPGFMPHGYCYLWDPWIVWLHVVSDGLITFSYYSIPIALVYLVRKRNDLPFNWIFWMFGLFIVGCGTTHLMEIWTVWHASYLLAGMVKAITAAVSVATALMLIPLVPKAIALPSLADLNEANRNRESGMEAYRKLEARHESPLQRRATTSFVGALLLTCFVSAAFWLSARLSSSESDLVTHTDETIGALTSTVKDVIDIETGARGFSLTGQESFLDPYTQGQQDLARDLDKLGQLIQDHADQSQRLELLKTQVGAAMKVSALMVARQRQSHSAPSLEMLRQGKSRVDTVRATIEEMEDEEKGLSSEHSQKTKTARQVTSVVAVLGTFVGLGVLLLTWFSLRHEIETGGAMRAEIARFNAELEQRVLERTQALETEIAERKQTEERLAEQAEELSRQAIELTRSRQEIGILNSELENKVLARTAELAAANKELEAFAYSVSHDLRAPLRHISGFTKILIEDFGASLPEEAQQHLYRVEQGGRRMGRLVDELLNLTRVGRQTLAVQVTGLTSLVKDVLSVLEPEIEDRKVEWKISDLPFVECDPTLIRQVFQNLISNALKYSGPRSQAVIEIGQVQKDGETAILVKDNGVGFSMKYADKLFGVFQRLHRAEDFEGSGVGLATVHRIIQKHGGRVWAEAELDRGATFYFTIAGLNQPAAQNAATAGGQR